MFRILTDLTNLQQVFASYSAAEALKVQHNIKAVIKQLGIPDKELLRQMRAEGLDLAEFAPAPAVSELPECSDTVLRSHMRSLFLSAQKLSAAIQALNLAQQTSVREQLEFACTALRLPSEQLLQRMAEQGLTLEKLGLVEPATDPLAAVRQRLAGALTADTQTTAADASQQDSLHQIRQRLHGLTADNAQPEKQIPAGENIVSLQQAVARIANRR
ncbi:hypothetical protein GCM10009098_20540 [Rheinheimera aquimaris]|uniref:Uncharacterized protein n=2 Tax=Rheinheimera aquimaris TaxID=412437 RepID=A0ABP3NTF9_9GAMM|nr:hypothetical protein [Rheinheimera aquimaris]MCB5214043.1 hypothetical protein [Rheinheimera aquimaris]